MRKLMLPTLAVLAVASLAYAQRPATRPDPTPEPTGVEPGNSLSSLGEPLASNFDRFRQAPWAGFIKAGSIYFRRDRIVTLETAYRGPDGPSLHVWIDGRPDAVVLRGKSIEELAAGLGMPELVSDQGVSKPDSAVERAPLVTPSPPPPRPDQLDEPGVFRLVPK